MKSKNFKILIFFFIILTNVKAQVGINTDQPLANLDVQGNLEIPEVRLNIKDRRTKEYTQIDYSKGVNVMIDPNGYLYKANSTGGIYYTTFDQQILIPVNSTNAFPIVSLSDKYAIARFSFSTNISLAAQSQATLFGTIAFGNASGFVLSNLASGANDLTQVGAPRITYSADKMQVTIDFPQANVITSNVGLTFKYNNATGEITVQPTASNPKTNIVVNILESLRTRVL